MLIYCCLDTVYAYDIPISEVTRLFVTLSNNADCYRFQLWSTLILYQTHRRYILNIATIHSPCIQVKIRTQRLYLAFYRQCGECRDEYWAMNSPEIAIQRSWGLGQRPLNCEVQLLLPQPPRWI